MATRSILTNVNLNKRDQVKQFLYAVEKSEKQVPIDVSLSRKLNVVHGEDLDSFIMALKGKEDETR